MARLIEQVSADYRQQAHIEVIETTLAELLPLADRLEALVVAAYTRKHPPPAASPAIAVSAPAPLVPAANDVSTRYIGRLR